MPFREEALLRAIAERSASLPARFPEVLVGPGDDCAVVRGGGDRPILLKIDQIVRGVHFTRETPPGLIARKAVARAVSDVAAMAGEPVCCVVGVVLPAGVDAAYAEALARGVHEAGVALGCPVVGGDTGVSLVDELVLSVSAVGRAHAARGPVLRSGARVGDDVYVTGTIGGSFTPLPTARDPFPGGGKHLGFSPRISAAKALADGLGEDLHAMMDVSDGLGIDADRMARASGVGIEIEGVRVPLSAGCVDVARACGDGEDYELLFCVSGGARARVPGMLVDPSGNGERVGITRVGWVVAGPAGCELLMPDGRRLAGASLGYEHGGGGS